MNKRVPYVDAGRAAREAQTRAVAAGDLTGRDWQTLTAIIVMISTYSRTADTATVNQVAKVAGLDVRHTRRSIQRLHERHIIDRESNPGRHPGSIRLPTPNLQKPPVDNPVDNSTNRGQSGPCSPTPTGANLAPVNRGQSGPPLREEEREESFTCTRAREPRVHEHIREDIQQAIDRAHATGIDDYLTWIVEDHRHDLTATERDAINHAAQQLGHTLI